MNKFRAELVETLSDAGLCDSKGIPEAKKLSREARLLIPAAGRGTRLQYDGPKALYPLQGKPLLQIIFEKLNRLISGVSVVINPDHEAQFKAFEKKSSIQIDIAYQNDPTGMGDAILLAEPTIPADKEIDIVILWGDQVSVSPATLLSCLLYHQHIKPDSHITFPTCYMDNPYIHFGRNSNGNVATLLQRREGDDMPATGENDCGLFIVRSTGFFKDLHDFKLNSSKGELTREFNFLPFLTWSSQNGKNVNALPIADSIETRGINTAEDASFLIKELNVEREH
jgi:bifunctional UDP-N-acetylglucosamine pyrophosphorylase/glucosamine-1-phosphate N-acetyltransferase